MERKHLFKSFEMKADEAGKIAGFFSTYEKTPDSYGDIIEPGAFTKTIEKRRESGHPFPLCWNHDFSAVIGAVEARRALVARSTIIFLFMSCVLPSVGCSVFVFGCVCY